MAKLFRKDQGSDFSSPESLDTLLQITNRRGWAILVTIAVCLALALAWSVWGAIPYTISGQGILFNRRGLFAVQSNGSGVLENVYFNLNDYVAAGQVVARVAGADLYNKLVGARNNLEQLQQKYDSMKKFGDQDLVRQRQALQITLNDANFAIKAAKERIKALQKRLADQKELFKVGLITQNDVQTTKEQLDTTQESVIKNTADLKQIQVQKDQLANTLEQNLRDMKLKVSTAQSNLLIAESTYNQETRVTSSYSGVVVGMGVAEGDRVISGQTLMSLSIGEQDKKYLEAVLYYPAAEAKRIKTGMRIQVAPGTVKVNKYGYALGLVTNVADYPATPGELLQVLNNQELVNQVQQMGAVLEVRAALIPNPQTVSGFTWTSSKGPPISIQAGTTCAAQVIVQENPPITLVIPMLKRFFFGVGAEE